MRNVVLIAAILCGGCAVSELCILKVVVQKSDKPPKWVKCCPYCLTREQLVRRIRPDPTEHGFWCYICNRGLEAAELVERQEE